MQNTKCNFFLCWIYSYVLMIIVAIIIFGGVLAALRAWRRRHPRPVAGARRLNAFGTLILWHVLLLISLTINSSTK